ncbi:MAG: hypothetical protein LBC64_03790 [Fibromonadaceae bacterium]|jgi:hypothetical protein|nr:hypothetical protein [Fibromonadaceae bacterium]
MKYNSDLHHRHSIRLQNYDYANTGAYFITMCCQNRVNYFGEIVNNVGAGSACPIMKPDLPTQNDLHITNPGLPAQRGKTPRQWWQQGQQWQKGQADPAPTVNTMNLNAFGKIVDTEWKNYGNAIIGNT